VRTYASRAQYLLTHDHNEASWECELVSPSQRTNTATATEEKKTRTFRNEGIVLIIG
jgi:hypothetical protein